MGENPKASEEQAEGWLGPDSEVRCTQPNAFPKVFGPSETGSNLVRWARKYTPQLRKAVHESGALLFRGFSVPGPGEFSDFAKALCPDLYTDYGDLADEPEEDEVYGTTTYPLEQPIHFHNEAAAATEWPLYLFFYCAQPALEGGATRLVDTRGVLACMTPAERATIRDRKLTYIRNHYPNLDVPWNTLFGTEDPREAERKCRENDVEFEWVARDSLRTRTMRKMIQRHPVTGDDVLFHHLFLNHPACLDPATREGLEQQFAGETFPRNVLAEGESLIPDVWVRDLMDAYEARAADVRWRAGDVLLLDNMLVSHGRAPFRGPRRILVAMGDMVRGQPPKPAAKDTEAADNKRLPPIVERTFKTAYREALERAAEAPARTAVTQGEQAWSYRDVAERASAIAALLKRREVRPGDRIAILGPAALDSIAAILAVWSRRGSILLVDPDLPPARQAQLLTAANARLLLHSGATPSNLAIQSLSLDGADSGSGSLQAEDAPLPDDEAYVFFTSGTTGRPKGIAGRHNSLAHFLNWQKTTFDVGPDDRVAQLTGFSFDVVLRDLFLPLTSGATLRLPTDMDPADPWPWLAAQEVTRIHCVPSLASYWLGQAAGENGCPTLKTTFFAGEPLPHRLAERWREATNRGVDIVNLYGPTETTLAKCWYRVPEQPRRGVQPIGEPLPGCEALILDGARICRPGETGEIALRTPYRTHGLIDRGDTTRPFEPNPLGESPHDLIYRTGDLGRRTADGQIDILGRIDDQIKIRGVRIEPQEISAVLAAHPEVGGAFVMRNPHDENGLLAYVAAKDRSGLARELHQLAAYNLPAACLPQRIVALDRLPLTPNGKVDRRALPLPTRVPEERERTPPRTPTESRLAALWQELIGLEEVSREDGFFEVGGHSLLAARLLTRIRGEWNVTLGIQELFERHTLAAMSQAIDSKPASADTADARLPRQPIGAPLPPSFSQLRLWFADQADPEKGVYNIPGSIRLEGPVDSGILEAALQSVVDRQGSLRTRFVARDGLPEQIVEPRAAIQLRRADVSSLPSERRREETRRLALQEARAPFDLDTAPLFRTLLVRESADLHFLVYVFHHTIADGRSNVLFIREVETAYLAFKRGERPVEPGLDAQYADYASWERRRVESLSEKQLEYWQRRLAGAPERLPLPTDQDRPTVQTFNGAERSLQLRSEQLERIGSLCRERRVTPFMVLLAALDVLLYKLTGETDLCVGTPAANRHHPAAERLIGCFINTLVLRSELIPEQTFGELLEDVKRRTMEAFENQETPFEQVVARTAPRRDPAYHPLFQVLFNVLYFEETAAGDGEVRMEREWLVDPESKFDFTLYVLQGRDSATLRMVYNSDLFSDARVADWLRRYEAILGAGLASLDTPIAEIGDAAAPPAAERTGHEVAARPLTDSDPTSLTESRIADVWESLLQCGPVDREDHFFELGGHSLLGMVALQRIRGMCGKPIPQSFLFRYPVLKDLAHAIDHAQAPVLRPIERKGRPTITLAQEAIWEYQRSNPGSCAYYVPRAVRIRGPLDAGLLQRAIQRTLQRHDALRTVYPEGENGAPQASAVDPAARLDIEDLTATPVENREAVEHGRIMAHVKQPFDLQRDLPVRSLLLKWSGDEHTLAVTTHHIAADCWSMGLPFQTIEEATDPWSPGVFFSDLAAHYQAAVEGSEPNLPSIPVENADVAYWRQENRRLGHYDEHAAYWKRKLEGAPYVLELPGGRKRPELFDYAGERRELEVPADIYRRVGDLARRCGATPFGALLYAFALSVQEWTGADDFLVGTPVSNRQQQETRHLIGLMANTVLLRMKNLERSAGDLRRQAESLHEAFQFQDYPIEYVLEDADLHPRPCDPPQVQLRFVMQRVQEAAPSASELRFDPVPIDRGVSKHDLSLVAAVHGDRLRAWAEYNTHLLDSQAMQGFASRYFRIVDEMLGWE